MCAVRNFHIIGKPLIGLLLLVMVPLWESFLIRDFFPSSSTWVYLLLLGIYSDAERLCRWWTWIFKTKIHVCHGTFLSVPLSESRCLSLQFFFRVIYQFSLSFMLFLFPYLFPEISYTFCIRLFISLPEVSINLLVEFSFVILEGPVLLLLLAFVPVSFVSQFFLSPVFFGLFLQDVLSVLSITCSRSFFISPSSSISHPAFYWGC